MRQNENSVLTYGIKCVIMKVQKAQYMHDINSAKFGVKEWEMKNKRENRISFMKQLKKDSGNYVLLAPALIYTLIFGYMTYPYMVIAFERYDWKKGIFSDFVGFKNFEAFFGSTWAWQVTRNTIGLNALFIITGTFCGVGLALLLNEVVHKKFLKVAQSTMLFPYFLSWVIVAFILYAILGTETGMLNTWLEKLGIGRINFYSSPKLWPAILAILRIWKGVGYGSIMYLATITGMDEEVFEAAAIDGASRWQQTVRITLPLLVPTICILILMDIGRIFFGDFTMIYSIVKDNGVLMPTTDVIDTYVFRTLRLSGDPSIAMAVGLYQSVLGFVTVFAANKTVKKFFPDGSLF